MYISYPVLSKWIRSATNSEIIFFLVLWICASVIPSSLYFQNLKLANLTFFGGFIGYPVLGFLLAERKLFQGFFTNKKVIIFTSFGLYILGFLITFLATYSLAKKTGVPGEKFYGYLTPNVLLMAIGIFLFFKEYDLILKNRVLVLVRDFLSNHCYGIFLLHPIILSHLSFFYQKGNPIIFDVIIFIAVSVITSLLIFIMSKVPLLKKVIG